MNKFMDKNVYVTEDTCKKCGGRCCKRHPCILDPTDIFGQEKPTVARLMEFLETGLFQIDWWEGDVLTEDEISGLDGLYDCIYMVRAREDASYAIASTRLYDPMYAGRCALLSDNGCMLKFEHRPMEGRALICTPEPHSDYGKREAAEAWRPLQYLFSTISDVYLKSTEICATPEKVAEAMEKLYKKK